MTLKRPWGLETGLYNLRNALKSNVHINELLSPTRFKGTVERTGNDGKKGSGNVSIQTFPQKHQGPMCSNSLATSLTLKTAKEYQKRAARSDPPWPQFAAPAESQTLGVYGCLIGGKQPCELLAAAFIQICYKLLLNRGTFFIFPSHVLTTPAMTSWHSSRADSGGSETALKLSCLS